MSSPTTVWIQIKKWKKYNDAKPTLKSTSWYRMANDWLEHPDFIELEASQCLLWTYLLGKASPKLKQRGVIYISVEHARYTSKIKTAEGVFETLQFFQSKSLIKLLNSPEEADFSDDDPEEDGESSEDVPNDFGKLSESVPEVFGDISYPRNGTERNVNKKTSSSCPDKAAASFTPEDFLAAWNEHRGPLEEIKRLTKGRAAKIAARRKEEPDLAYWIACIKRLAASDLTTGKVKSDKYPHGWKADLTWLIKNDENHVKVSEGRYDNKTSKKQPAIKVFRSEEDFA